MEEFKENWIFKMMRGDDMFLDDIIFNFAEIFPPNDKAS